MQVAPLQMQCSVVRTCIHGNTIPHGSCSKCTNSESKCMDGSNYTLKLTHKFLDVTNLTSKSTSDHSTL